MLFCEMVDRFIFLFVLFFYFEKFGNCQVLPYYSASKYFYANEARANIGSGSNTYNLPATFPISTASHRKPFYSVMAVQNIKIENHQKMYFWTELTSYTSTSMVYSIYFLRSAVGSVTNYFGFEVPSYLKFRYLLVLDTFPNKFLSVAILKNSLSQTIAAVTMSFDITTIVTPAPLAMSSTDTVFIHSLTDLTLASNKALLDSSFQIQFSYSVINATDFAVQISAKYPITLTQVQIKVFIYNKTEFDNLYVKLDYHRIAFSNLAVGIGQYITKPYTARFIPALTTDIVYGIQGFQLSGYVNTGFQFTIQYVGNNDYDIKLSNLWATSTIPRLDLLILLPSQFRCPYLELLIDVTQKICYNTSCPLSTFKSGALGVTGIYRCEPCISTCYECSLSDNNCTSCYPNQNRELVGSSCVPKSGFYEASVAIAQPCNSNCVTCQLSATNCKSCNTTSYLTPTNTCANCSSKYPNCIECGPLICSKCALNYGMAADALSCFTCTSYSTYCIECDAVKCLNCDISNGYVLSSDMLTCITCSGFDPNCVTCTSAGCTGCDSAAGYFLSSGTPICASCQIYDIQCKTCDTTACLTCANGYFLNSSNKCETCTTYNSQCLTCNTLKCLSCSSGYFLTSTNFCEPCSTKYEAQCITCDSSSCTKCSPGFTLYQSKCQSLKVICGDGLWIEKQQNCDDGNLLNDDGCNQFCQIEPDYVCQIADKLPSGASFCKYTKKFSVNLNSIQKDPSSNKLHVFMDLQPTTFKQLTKESIMNFISPIEIVNPQTGKVKQIPSQNIDLIYHTNKQTGQVEIVIDYGQNNLQGSYLKFNLQPDKTNIKSLADIKGQTNLMIQLSSQGYAFYFYDYPSDIYETQDVIQNLSFVVGILFFLFAILGFLIPAGKLIVFQGLAVIQIGYFSLLEFQKISPTFQGLKNLNLSNGFNDLNFFTSSILVRQNIFNVIGLKNVAFSNYNINLILFVILPIIIGGIGYLIAKRSHTIEYKKVRKNSENDEDVSNDQNLINSQGKQLKPSSAKIIFQRILLESTFYGILFGGYLGWISILYSFKNPQPLDYVFMSLILISSTVYVYLFVRCQSKQVSLNQLIEKSQNAKGQDLKISTQFGEFANAHQQLMPDAQGIIMKKFYLFFLGQRLLNSIVLVILPEIINFTSPILIATYLIQLVCMHILYRKFQKDNESISEERSMFSYIYQNYVLRQSINFITIILIQVLYLSVTISIQSNGPYQTFVKNQFITKGVPFSILSLLFLNICFNIFCWVWELKSDRLIQKFKAVFFTNQQQTKCYKRNLQITVPDQEQINRVMNTFIENSPIFQCRKSPFLGISQKQSPKKALLDLVKIQQQVNVVDHQPQQSERNIESQMINQLWDQI